MVIVKFFILVIQISQFTIFTDFTTAVSTQSHIFLLESLAPNCADGVITSFTYVPGASGQIRISYTCTANSAILAAKTSKTTTPVKANSVNTYVLSQHVVDCGVGSAITSFTIKNDGCYFWYQYECRTIIEESCTTLTTAEFPGNSGKWVGYKLSYFLACPILGTGVENTAIQKFELKMRIPSDEGYYSYQYKKCTIRYCDIACNGCNSSYNSSDCIACAVNLEYYPLINNLKKCVTTPPIGYYYSTGYHRLCLTQCYTCSGGGIGDNHECTQCAATYFPLQDLKTSCYAPTPYGYFKSSNGLQWDNCYRSCAYCPGLGNDDDHLCSECRTGYFPLVEKSSKCYNTVQYQHYLNQAMNKWDFCYYSCGYCTTLGTEDDHKCTECLTNYFPLVDKPSKCYPVVVYGYLFNSNLKRWDLCYPTCQFCSDPGDENDHKCTSCIQAYYPLKDKPSICSQLTPPAYFFNSTSLTWDNCYITCATCKELGTISDNKCTSCQTDYYPLEYTSQCVRSNTLGYYFDSTQQRVFQCDISCKTCIQASTICVTCNFGFFLNKEINNCVKICPDGYFENETEQLCDKCSDNCSRCTTNKDFCLACSSGLFFLDNACIQKCPEGFYEDYSTMKCMPCYERCQTCSNGGKADCITCVADYPYYRTGECTSGCLAEELILPLDYKCRLVSSCIKYFMLDIPYVFSIEYSDFKAKITMELTSDCSKYHDFIMFQLNYHWTELYKGKLSDGGTLLTIAADNLLSGLKTFNVTIRYNDVNLDNVIKYCQFKNNRLIPVVKNSESLSTLFGYPIILDGSLSFDEGMIDDAITSNIDDPELHFKWECPNEINSNCTFKTDKILKLSSDDYSGLKDNVQKSQEYNARFKLYLMKGNRTSKTEIKVAISNPSEMFNLTTAKTKYERLILILPRLRGMKGEDFIFDAKFKDETIDKSKFGYHWTVRTIENPEKYLNGRNEDVLRLRNEDLLLGENQLYLEFYEKDSPENKYITTYTYIKVQAPYGGNCHANPNSGYSLKTKITFSANGWQSKNFPLSYKFYMTTLKGFQIALTDDIIPMTEYTTSIIPVGTKFFLDVIDSTGLTTTVSCQLVIEKYTSSKNINQEQLNLNEMLEKMYNPKLKLLLIEAFYSNDFLLDSQGVEKTVAMLDNIVDTTSEKTIAKSINKNMDIILSQLNSISVSQGSSEPSVTENVDKLMSNVINHMESIVQNHNKVEGLINILNNNYEHSNAEANKTAVFVKIQNNIKQVQIKLFENMVPGQTVIFSNAKFASQTGRISKKLNPYSIIDDSSANNETRVKMRRILFQNEEGCLPGSAVCIPSDMLKNISSQVTDDLGIISKLNKASDILPISEESFSKTSLDMHIAQQNLDQVRLLTNNELKMSYTIRLKAPYLNSSSVSAKINDTACVQYDAKLNSDSKSCTTWYDYNTMEIVCICTKQGLTVNVLDKTFSSFSKLAQFPALTEDLINVYSLSIVGSLIVLLLILLGVGYYQDKLDKKKKKYVTSEHFDVMQYYIIQYTKEGFDKNYSLWNLYWFILKTCHPILSILSIYSPTYYRSLRVLDFFLKIYVSFFFTFLPIYATDNEVKIQNEKSRDVKNMGVRFDDLGLTIQQIVDGVIYSIASNIISNIILMPLSLLIYSDVLKDESEKRKNAMQRIVRVRIIQKPSKYAEKVTRAMIRLRVLLILSQVKVSKSKPENNSSQINPLGTIHCLINTPHKRRSNLLRKEIFEKENEYDKFKEYDKNSERELNSFSHTMNSRNSDSFKLPLEQILPEKMMLSETNVENDSQFTYHLRCMSIHSIFNKKFVGLEEMTVGSLELRAIHNSHSITRKPRDYLIRNGERKYLFLFPKDSQFQVSCSYCNFSRASIESHEVTICHTILSIIKFLIVIGLDILIWIYLLVFIVGIYKNFGTQIVTLCIIPLISVFITKLVILTCLMLFLETLVMFYFGHQIYSLKMFSIKVILFHLLVPPIASSHHRAILLYRTIMRT